MIGLLRAPMRLLFWLLCLAAAAGAIYFLVRLVLAYWLPIVVSGFLLAGSIGATLMVVTYFRILRQPGLDSVGIGFRWAAAKGLGKIRLLALLLAEPLVALTGGWATGILHVLMNLRTITAFGGQLRSNAAFTSLSGVAGRHAPTTLVFVAGAVAAAALLDGTWEYRHWLRFFLIVLMVNIAVRHFIYAADDESLPTKLRRSATSPWIAVLVIAICDGLSYLLILGGLLHWEGPSSLPLAPFRDIAKAFIFGSISDLMTVVLDGGWPRPEVVLIAGLSALYGAAGLRSFTKSKDFGRTDEDHVAIARNYAILGRYVDALTELEKTRKSSTAGRLLRAAVMVGLSRFDQAQADMRAAYRIAGLEVTPRAAYAGLVMVCSPFRYATESYNEILRIGIADGAPDTYISCIIMVFAGSESRYTIPAALPLFDDADTASRYPLSAAMVFIESGELDRAKTALALLQPDQSVGSLIAECLRAKVGAADPTTTADADRAAFDRWSHEALGVFAKVTTVELDAIEHLAALLHLQQMLALAMVLRSPHEQAWRYRTDELSEPLAVKLASADPLAPDPAMIKEVLAQQLRAALAALRASLAAHQRGLR